MMAMAKCPECEAEIQISDDIMAGEIVSCSDCGLELEVKKTEEQALELQKLTLEKEDWGE